MQREGFNVGTLIDRVEFSEDLARFRFKLNVDFTFQPGQYAMLAFEKEDGKILQRAYSIASMPYEDYLEFYIELVPHGRMTPKIWQLKVGDNILVKNQLRGKFTLHTEFGKRRFIQSATVTGLAPFASMVKSQKYEMEKGTFKGEPNEFVIIHGGSRSWELGTYLEEMRALDKELDWFHYVPIVSRPWEDEKWQGETGRADDVIRKYMQIYGFDGSNCVGYACGHPTMISNVLGILERARVPKEHIFDEKYFTIKEEGKGGEGEE